MKFLICWNSLAQTWRNSSCHNKWIKNVWYLAYLFTFGKSISVLIFVLIIFYVVTDIGKLWESDYFGFSENTWSAFPLSYAQMSSRSHSHIKHTLNNIFTMWLLISLTFDAMLASYFLLGQARFLMHCCYILIPYHQDWVIVMT